MIRYRFRTKSVEDFRPLIDLATSELLGNKLPELLASTTTAKHLLPKKEGNILWSYTISTSVLGSGYSIPTVLLFGILRHKRLFVATTYPFVKIQLD